MCASLQPWGQRRWPHQVRFRVGWCLVDLPQTEEALSISNSTLPAEPRGISTTAQIDITDTVCVCLCVCTRACTLLPLQLKYRRVTLALPACLKQMSCWGLFHSNIRTLPSWAPVISDVCSQTERAKGTRDKGREEKQIRNRIWRTWTTATAFKLTLTILVDGMRCHSFHIIKIPFHNLKKKQQNINILFFQDTTDSDKSNMTELSINLWIFICWTVFAH